MSEKAGTIRTNPDGSRDQLQLRGNQLVWVQIQKAPLPLNKTSDALGRPKGH